MRAGYLLILAATFFLFCSGKKSKSIPYDAARLYSVAELQEDLRFYREKLERHHPNLYLYTPKEKLDQYFDSLYNGIHKPMTECEFYRHITPVLSVIKDGHNFITPGKAQADYKNKHGNYFPFHVQWLQEKLYIDMNYTDAAIPLGAEIISINAVPAAQVANGLLMRLPRDGENKTLPEFLLNTFFTGLYYNVYGEQEEFVLSYRDTDGAALKTCTVKALLYDSILAQRSRKYPARYKKMKASDGITLELNKELSAATLTVPSFDKTTFRKQYHQNFRNVIDEMMEQVTDAKMENLVIDVRGNGGGNPAFSRYLLCYLVNQPFRYADACYMVRRSNTKGKRPRNKKRYLPGMGLGKFKPFKNAFKGNVYVLTDGGSFSATGEFASCLNRYHRAVFIGDEVSGNKTIEGGQVFSKSYTMPHTKIMFSPATEATYLCDPALNDGHGVIPQYPVPLTIDDVISGEDAVKVFAYELIRSSALKHGK